jgi:3,4-dihydroxyphenylacetate 2,3-dioxygenase
MPESSGPKAVPPDVLRTASIQLVVTDLAASRAFYHDVLGLLITCEDSQEIHLRGFEEYLHHSLVLHKGPVAAIKLLSYRVRSPKDLDLAEHYHRELGCRVERVAAGTTLGFGAAVRVEDPLGFPLEFFCEAEHVERYTQRYDAYRPATLMRLDHANILTSDLPATRQYYLGLGFRVSEEIRDELGTTYAAWMFRKPSVHDIALTAGDGPRLHHFAFNVQERQELLNICDLLGAIRQAERIERGPGHHGVTNACYLYMRDPDGHRVEVFTQNYYTGDPDNPIKIWDVHDNRRRSWWGHAIIPTWFTEGSQMLTLDGEPRPLATQSGSMELKAMAGAEAYGF